MIDKIQNGDDLEARIQALEQRLKATEFNLKIRILVLESRLGIPSDDGGGRGGGGGSYGEWQ